MHYEVHYSSPYRDEDNPRLVKTDVMEEGPTWKEWLDIAGTPADKIKPDLSTIDLTKQPFQEKFVGLK
jgi:hypothetical protein